MNRRAEHSRPGRLIAVAVALGLLVLAVTSTPAAAAAPTATTGAALSLTSSSANVTGTVNPNGEETTYSFQYGTTTGYGFQTNPQSAGAGTQGQVVSGTLTGLTAGTIYHYRVIATNASGTTVGADMTFTTLGSPPPPSPPPTATTGTAGSIGSTSARVRGRINPRGASTTYRFEYGLTPAYGSQTTPRTLAAGNRTRSVSAAIAGLQPGLTYHYRLVATNSNGIGLGNDRTFTTAAATATRALPTLTSRAKPRRDRVRPFRFRVRGTLIAPAGVDTSRACRGRVTIRFKLRRRTVALRRTRITASCRYSKRVRVRLTRRARLRVLVRFRGNAVLKPKSAPIRRVRAG